MRSAVLSRAWLVVAMLWLVALLNYCDRLMITTMRLSLKEAIPMTDAQFGLLTPVFLMSGIYAGGLLKDASVNLSRLFQFAAFTLAACALLLFLVRPRRADDVSGESTCRTG